MTVTVLPSKATGTVAAPPSKSMAHRALICGALSEECLLRGVAFSEDIETTIGALQACGAVVEKEGDRVRIGGFDPFSIKEGTDVFCNESGSTLRFLIPFCLLSGARITLSGSERLMQRPLGVYEKICRENGFLFEKNGTSLTVRGRLTGGRYEIDGSVSSQFVTGLLFALSLLDEPSTLVIGNTLESAPYVDMTLAAMKAFGVSVRREGNRFELAGKARYEKDVYDVEGDYSNAAFLDAFNAVGGAVTVTGLRDDSLQGDRVYKEMFHRLQEGEKTFDLTDCPDLAPVLFALAAFFGGARFTGTARLKLKESDRGAAMAEELEKFGVHTRIEENEIEITADALQTPKTALCGHNDHRIVMALSVLASVTGGVIVDAQAIKKSYPNFFDDINGLGIGIKKDVL